MPRFLISSVWAGAEKWEARFKPVLGLLMRPSSRTRGGKSDIVREHRLYDICIITVNRQGQCRGHAFVKYVRNFSSKFPETVRLVLWCFVTKRPWLWPGVTWYSKSNQLRSLPTENKLLKRWEEGSARLFPSSLIVMVNSCLTVEYPPVHRSVVVVDTSLLGCGSRSVYVFYTRWDVQWRFWSDCYCTCWLCIVTTGRNKGLSFPVCLKSLCVKCSVAKATAAHPSYAATRWETQSQAIDGYNGSTFNCCLCGGYRRFGLDSLFFGFI